jgi:putative ABC transport system permease protein
MSYYVEQHARDISISIRMALGGTAPEVLRPVVGRGMRVVAAGVLADVAAALAATRMMSSLLFGVGAADVPTFAVACLFLLTIALVACVIPARRAVGLEPASVLRRE